MSDLQAEIYKMIQLNFVVWHLVVNLRLHLEHYRIAVVLNEFFSNNSTTFMFYTFKYTRLNIIAPIWCVKTRKNIRLSHKKYTWKLRYFEKRCDLRFSWMFIIVWLRISKRLPILSDNFLTFIMIYQFNL